MSFLTISPSQLQQLQYPNGAGAYHYANTPVQVNQSADWVNGVQPGGVSAIGNMPVQTGVAVDGSLPSTGIPTGAAAGPASAAATGMGGFGSIASGAIDKIAGVASQYIGAKAQADALKNTQAVPQTPEAEGPLAAFMAPKLGALGGGGRVTVQQ